jgi:thiamine kinase-like enzyme
MPLTLFKQLSQAGAALQNQLGRNILSRLPDALPTLQSVSTTWKSFISTQFSAELVRENFIRQLLPHCQAEFAEAKPQDFVFTPLWGGLTNFTYKLTVNDRSYVIRISGNGSDSFIDRAKEGVQAIIASELGVNTEVIYFDFKTGSQVTRFYENAITQSAETLKEQQNCHVVNTILRTLHQSEKPFLLDENAFERNRKFLRLIAIKAPLPRFISDMMPTIDRIERIISTLALPKVPCHNDTTPGNFLISAANPTQGIAIDFEYSGQNDPVWDLSNLAMEAEFKAAQDDFLLKDYYQTDAVDPLVRERFYLYQAVIEYYVVLWCQLQIVNHNYVGDQGLDKLIALREQRYDTFLKVIFSKEYIDAIRFFENRQGSLQGKAMQLAAFGMNKVTVADSKETVEQQTIQPRVKHTI